MELTICDEPADIPEFDALPEDLRAEITPFLSGEFDDYSTWIMRLEEWINRGAHVPQLYNRLMAGYHQADRPDDAAEMVRRTYARFPDYFFGKVGYATQLVDDGRLAEAQQVCGGTFGIVQIAGRTTLHSSEVRAWGLLTVKYLLAQKNLKQARATCDFVRSISPDHPLTLTLERMLENAELTSAIELIGEIVANEDRLLSADK